MPSVTDLNSNVTLYFSGTGLFFSNIHSPSNLKSSPLTVTSFSTTTKPLPFGVFQFTNFQVPSATFTSANFGRAIFSPLPTSVLSTGFNALTSSGNSLLLVIDLNT